MRRLLPYIFLFALASLARAQEPRVSARTDSAMYKVGEWIHLYVDAALPQGVDSLVVAVKDSLGPFEILTVESPPANTGRQQWVFRLTIFDTGDVFVPPAAFAYRVHGDTLIRFAHSNPIPLTIVAIPVDYKGDVKDIKPPLDAPWLFEDYLPYIIALAVLVLLALAYWYYVQVKRRRDASYVPPKPAIPPWRVALAALHTLEDQRLWQQGKVKEFYSGVTEIIRRFLEDQYGVFALESTSDEIMAQLKELPDAGPNLNSFRSFFTTADLVKFAKFLPTPEENQRELAWGFSFVRAMTPHPPTPTQPAEIPGPMQTQEVENVR